MQSNHKINISSAAKLKRLCYVITSFPQISETFIVEEALSLYDFDVDFCIFALKEGNFDLVHPSAQALLDKNKIIYTEGVSKEQAINALIKLMIINPLKTLKTLIKAINHPLRWRYFQALPYAQQILKTKTDYIHAHFADDNLCYAAILSEWSGIPYGFTMHGYDLRDDPIGIKKLMRLANKANSIVTVSEFYKGVMVEKYGLNIGKIYVAYNGIRMELFKPNNHRSEADFIQLLNVGRLVPLKGQDILLEAVAKVIEKGHKVKLRIIGEGSSRIALENQIHKLKLNGVVELLGAKSQQEVQKYLAESDIFIMPSRKESFGITCIEAMAMQVAVIASDAEGLPEVVDHQETGLLFSSENINELVDAIILMIQNKQIRLEMGIKGRERVLNNFTRERVTNGLIEYFSQSVRN